MANLLAYGENVIGSDVGSSGGHIIENSSGVDMTQRNKLQFIGNGVTVTDDSTNDRTVVTISGGSGSGLTILSYGTSTWQDFINAYNNNNIVFCKASIMDSDPSSGTQSRHAVLSYVDDPANPTQAEFLYPKTTNRHDYNHQTDTMSVYTLDSTNGWSCSTRYTSTNIVPRDGIAYTYNSTKGGTIYLSTPSITGSFSDATNYTVGDYVYYENNLYKCTTDHTAGAWDASHFTQTTVASEIASINNIFTTRVATIPSFYLGGSGGANNITKVISVPGIIAITGITIAYQVEHTGDTEGNRVSIQGFGANNGVAYVALVNNGSWGKNFTIYVYYLAKS